MGRGGSAADPVTLADVPVGNLLASKKVGADLVDPTVEGKGRVISVKELALHSSKEDCWVAVSGKVYDITSWIPKHPGGLLPILDTAGQDVTDAFTAFHPSRVKNLLPKYYIGELEPTEVHPMTADFRKLRQELEDAGLFETRYSFYYKQLSVFVPLFTLAVAGVLFTKSIIIHMMSAVVIAMMWNMSSFIGHDLGHSGITKNRKIDSFFGLIAGNIMTGVGLAWWKSTHNVHHIVCNSLEFDPDLQHVPLFAVSKDIFSSYYSFYHFRKITFDAFARFMVSYQHLTFYPIMAIARINLYIQSLIHLVTEHKTENKGVDLFCLGLFWLWFSSLISALPSTGERVAFFFVCLATCGLLHVQFCISHFAMPTFHGRPENDCYFQTQLNGTQNIICPRWMDWFFGGLQFQIEHHCFPRLPRHNLRQVVPRVEAICKKHNAPHVTATFLGCNKMLVNTLRIAAMEARGLKNPEKALKQSVLWDGLFARG